MQAIITVCKFFAAYGFEGKKNALDIANAQQQIAHTRKAMQEFFVCLDNVETILEDLKPTEDKKPEQE